MEKRKFKTHEICLMITAVINDEKALSLITEENKTKWAHAYQKDDDDRAVEVALLFERLFFANHFAIDYNERIGWTKCTFEMPMINIEYLLDSKEWRQLKDIELLKLLVELWRGVFTENGVVCMASESDYDQLMLLITYYYDKLLVNYVGKIGEDLE